MFSKTFLNKIKENLLEQRQLLINNAIENQNVHIDTDGDEYDEAQGNLLIEMHNQLNTRNNEKIIKIDNALKLLEDDAYGICEDCGEQIPEKRLLSNPYTPICVWCAEERETEEKQRKRELP